MKKAIIITISVVLAVACVATRLARLEIGTVRLEWSVPSPDRMYVAKISSKWRDSFWGKDALEIHELLIKSKDGRVVRQIVINEPWTVMQGPKMHWSVDGDIIYLVLKPQNALCTGINIPVR